MSLESFNLQTLIHVGVELVVVGGLAFWANRRIVGVENSVADLAKRVVALEGVIEKQQQFMLQQDQLLRQMLGMTEPQRPQERPQETRQPPLRPQPTPQSQPVSYPQSSPQPQPVSYPYPQPTPSVSYPPQQQPEPRPNIPQPRSPPVQEDPDISSDILDDIINKELGNMASGIPEMEIQMTESPKTPIKKKKTQIVAARKKKSGKDPLNAEL